MELYLGMISGTSRDGADTVLVDFDGDRPRVHGSLCLPYPANLAELLKRMVETGQRPPGDELSEADDLLACGVRVVEKAIARIHAHGLA